MKKSVFILLSLITNHSFAQFSGGNGSGYSKVTYSGGTLPIELKSFTGKCDHDKTLLLWTTASEINNDYFTIEKSANATEWEILGTQYGAGNSSMPIDYSYKDMKISNNLTYYRLKQTDFDGRYNYSKIILVEPCNLNKVSFSVFLNTNKGLLNLKYSGDISSVKSVEILNALGNVVYSSKTYTNSINMQNQQSGNYFVKLTNNSETFVQKIVLSN